MNEPTVVFAHLIEQMKEAEVPAADRPTILGGQFDSKRLAAFLAAWRVDWEKMPWRIWEHVSDIAFADKPREPDLLQRGEVFGEGGHLSLRRDGQRWFWHYIGPADQPGPAGFGKAPECEDFWADRSNQGVTLRKYEEQVLLWGKEILDETKQPPEHTGRWWEDRVAAARLDYPGRLKGHNHVYLTFWRFTDGGRTVFVWYREMKGGA
jgi:hypothetical protein